MSRILNSEPAHIIVDPATEAAMRLNAEMKAIEIAGNLKVKYEGELQKWFKDTTRSNSIKEAGISIMDSNNKLIEVCSLYFKDEEGAFSLRNTTESSFFNLSLTEEASLLILPYAKDLMTNDIYYISDSYVQKRANEEYARWVAICAEKPSFADQVPKPPEFIYKLDTEFDARRFFIDKFDETISPSDFYTFILPTYVLLLRTNINDDISSTKKSYNIDINNPPNNTNIGDYFLYNNKSLEELSLSNNTNIAV